MASQKQKVLDLLKKKSKVYHRELNRICFRYSSRIKDLRDEKYKIETICEGRGLFSYKLISEPKKVKQN